MRAARLLFPPLLFIFSVLSGISSTKAQTLTTPTLPTPTCAWQLEWTTSGLGNWFFPDTGNRWFYMPIDPQWRQVTINGEYPETRFFSIAVYDNAPVSTGLAGRVYDANIEPDPGSINPFANLDAKGKARGNPQKYTVTIARTGNQGSNSIQLHANNGWLVYRLYLPNEGQGTTAGVPLPAINVTDTRGQTTSLTECTVRNRQSEVSALVPQIIPPLLENPTPVPPVPDRILFAPISEPPPRLLPNPDNKYLISYFLPEYQKDRLIVVRGKMPGFPDTFNSGFPITKPAPGFDTVQLRYWSMCLGSLVSPLPIEGCAVDAVTPINNNGYYTVVITNDVLRPNWLPDRVTWIPWGDEKMVPKLFFLRNTLASADFIQSAQNAVTQGCGISFNFPIPPAQDTITTGGQCAQQVMGDYYPEATWCDRSDFEAGGWKACFSSRRNNKARK